MRALIVTIFIFCCIMEGLSGQKYCHDRKKESQKFDKYVCAHDGSFFPVQCPNGNFSLCHCVHPKTGMKLGDYKATSEADMKNMDCLCARRRSMIPESISPSYHVTCLNNGNFPKNCWSTTNAGGGNAVGAINMNQLSGRQVQCSGGHHLTKKCNLWNSGCSCQDKYSGKRISAYSFDPGSQTDCECAQDELDERKLFERCTPLGSYPISTGKCDQQRLKAARMLRDNPEAEAYIPKCHKGRKFSALQCSRDWCWCAKPTDGQKIEQYIWKKGTVPETNCKCAVREYNTKRERNCPPNGNGAPKTCQKAKEKRTYLKCSGNNYAPRQCKNGVCRCVDTITGKRIGQYSFPPFSASSDCKCASDKKIYSYRTFANVRCGTRGEYVSCAEASRRIKQVKCDSDGKYLKKQCLRSSCFCVNEFGTRLTIAVEKHLVLHMKCDCALARDAHLRARNYDIDYNCNSFGNYPG